MADTVRSEISKKNPYWIDKHRYYELKHFCMQYPMWKKMYLIFDGLSKRPIHVSGSSKTGMHSDPTAECVTKMLYYRDRMELVEQSALAADGELYPYILKGVTEELSYDILRVRMGIPCCKDVYYKLYRKFFWILDRNRK